MTQLTIWVDADACPKPIKEIIYKTSQRLQLPIVMVANSYMHIPHTSLISFVKVDQGDDVADHHICEKCKKNDIVITQDVPLAALVIKLGAHAINSRGELYTEENIHDRLATRDLMKDLRDSGINTGGPPPFNSKNTEHFANSLNKILTRLLKT